MNVRDISGVFLYEKKLRIREILFIDSHICYGSSAVFSSTWSGPPISKEAMVWRSLIFP